jgi:cation/acetate symporter
MVVGVSLSLYYILRVEFDSIPWLGVSGFKMEPWFHVQATSAGLFGVVAGFATIIIVSLLTKPEPGSADFLGRIRLASRRMHEMPTPTGEKPGA